MTTTATATTAPEAPPAEGVYVFTYPCGCPSRNPVPASQVADEEAAWRQVAPLGSERKLLALEGVTVHLVDQAEYEQRYAPLMRIRCPHPRADR